MIIGISGKIGSGKDTVGEMIQFLSADKKPYNLGTFIKSLTDKDFHHINSLSTDWENKKFADKLKDIICMLISCTREKLEDREFKEAELGEEWDLYNIKTKNGEYFAINYSLNQAQKYIDNSYKYDVVKMTPRKMLQILGTEAGRGLIHPQIWVNSLMADYKGIDLYRDSNPSNPWKFPNWLVTDTRFPNEADAIKERGGILIRVNRGDPIFKN